MQNAGYLAALLLALVSSSALAGKKAEGVARDDRGRIERSSSEKADFKKDQPLSLNGQVLGRLSRLVVDHVKPLCKGGADKPSNMQWQTKVDAREKDRTECK